LLVAFLMFYLEADAAVVGAAIALLVALQLHEFVRTVLATRLSIARLLAVDVASHALRLSTLTAAAMQQRLSIATALTLIAASSLVALTQLDRRWFTAHAIATWSRNWSFGRWLLVEAAAYHLSTRIYLYVLAAMLGQQQVAALSTSQNIANAVNVLAMGVSAASMPIATLKLKQEGFDAWRKWLVRVTVWLSIATGSALIGLVAFGDSVMRLVYPGYYAQFSTLLALLACGAWLEALSANLTTTFWTAERPDLN